MSETGEALLRVEGLVKHYADAGRVVRVLEGADLTVTAGEKIAIIGESGVGKSTLLHLLGALDRPTAGTVWYDGQSISELTPAGLADLRNHEIAFVFQFHHLLADFTAEENVMMPALIAGEPSERAREKAQAILRRVGLGDRLDHKPGELSGGEQQRVAVARAALREPRVLLADEPTGNLDPATGDEVARLLVELNRERRMALVIATHNERLAHAMDRVLRLRGGKLEPVA